VVGKDPRHVATLVDMLQQGVSEPLIRIEEVAKRLGLSRRGVEALVARRAIPAFKISRRCLRFRWAEVESAIERYRQKEIR
jgi:excisionase family DNA binding protein